VKNLSILVLSYGDGVCKLLNRISVFFFLCVVRKRNVERGIV